MGIGPELLVLQIVSVPAFYGGREPLVHTFL
jgi:hypothetical protein